MLAHHLYSQDLTIGIDPQQKTLMVGETVNLDVVVENVTNLGAFEFTILYNTDVVHASSAQVGAFPASTGRTVIPVGPSINNLSASGTVTFGGASMGTDAGPNGSGVLGAVTFTALAEGSTTLNLQNIKVTDINGQTVTVDTLLPGQVTVGTSFVLERGIGPDHYSLHQNYPNPFNPTTAIRFSIPKSSHVSLKIYNLSGQFVETLIDEEKPSGEYEIQWNAENFMGGIYLCRLKAGGFVEMKKLILQK